MEQLPATALTIDLHRDEGNCRPEQEACKTDPHGDAAVGGALKRGQRQGRTQRAMKPRAQQPNEADERGARSEEQSGENHDKADVGQRFATPALGLRVVLPSGQCNLELAS